MGQQSTDLARSGDKPSGADETSDLSVRVGQIYSWASQLASESRDVNWVARWYLWPDAVRLILGRLDRMEKIKLEPRWFRVPRPLNCLER